MFLDVLDEPKMTVPIESCGIGRHRDFSIFFSRILRDALVSSACFVDVENDRQVESS